LNIIEGQNAGSVLIERKRGRGERVTFNSEGETGRVRAHIAYIKHPRQSSFSPNNGREKKLLLMGGEKRGRRGPGAGIKAQADMKSGAQQKEGKGFSLLRGGGKKKDGKSPLTHRNGGSAGGSI